MNLRDRIKSLRRVRAKDLRPNPKNWRTHPQAQQDALRGVLAEVGIADALLARELPDGTLQLIDGHLRADVAPDVKWPVLILDVTEEEADLLLATVDPLANMAEADPAKVAELLAGVESTSDAVQALLDGLGAEHGEDGAGELQDAEPQIDRAVELQKEWRTERGQLWEIPGKAGVHRVLCGDSTDAEDVGRVLGDAVPFLCVTDPPYGVEYDPSWRNVEAAKGNLAYAARRVGKVANDDRADWRAAWELFPGAVLYSWHPAGATSLVHAAALQDSGFVIRMQIIWAKSNFPIGRGDYHVRHEPCWYAVRKGQAARRTDDRTQTTLWEINLNKNIEGGHSTQKPLECMARPMRNHDAKEVYDPFLGSGTTLIAAELLGRVCYGIEISPAYVAVILQRCKDAGMEPRLANGEEQTR